ncbi:MAG: fertility inhibition FinO-like protein [Symploca sp. SIO3C6]|uniref:Fertility inhibition FinO-like protein n=1 Tax=Symploca sp. SIO1C4 TaxID=2607765 RepID=A0A6B3NE50_9CYAN|nr:fertility inhibition FinO-like protein [Symploca sp. SIO3C6]NER29870.1 fertility inhibition FinO-like protein [Symploca sp. SIO1C4]NET07765.1 fertility inhibition FinO-like protein [Symploca sp. SIO2B6]NET53426.1 fertility inhibition FinO-like protein [Merismopedia sp. SIO2A8]
MQKAGEVPQSQTKQPKVVPSGRLELTIKINELPTTRTVKNGWQEFEVDCDGTIFTITVKPKVWKKLTTADDTYPMWVAAIGGKLGAKTNKGFVLDTPGIQVYEKKPKAPQEAPASQPQEAPASQPQEAPASN